MQAGGKQFFRRMGKLMRFLTLGVVCVGLVSCGSTEPDPKYGDSGALLERSGDEIAICGQLYHTGTKVVLWNDAGGCDAGGCDAGPFDPPRVFGLQHIA